LSIGRQTGLHAVRNKCNLLTDHTHYAKPRPSGSGARFNSAGQAAGEVIRSLAWAGPSGSEAALSQLKRKLPASDLQAVVQRIGADLLGLTDDQLAAHLVSEALTGICDDSKSQGA
jgi:hypothetical protein